MRQARLQSFDDRADRPEVPARLAALRAELARRGLTGFVVPRADRHQNEYVPPSDKRLAWLTGFTGSAGTAIVLPDRAVLFVDGRYVVQVRDQVDTSLFEIVHLSEVSVETWIEKNVSSGVRLGFDPWLHTPDQAEKLADACTAAGADLVPADTNPIDAVWRERPHPPLGSVALHDLAYAGEETAHKLARLRAELSELRVDALVVSDPHALAWTFNIRGADVAHTPLPLGFAIVPRDGRPALYIDGRKLSNAVRAALAGAADIHEPDRFLPDLIAIARLKKRLRVDAATAADALVKAIVGADGEISRGIDPIALMKAVKNGAEIAGARAAHVRDGVAMVHFLAWFAREAPSGRLTEIDAVCALEDFRRETGRLKDISFPTIAGTGPNGAIVHYRVTSNSNRTIAPGDLFLVDSGGQYEDGTTDVTRTLAVGTPSADMRDRFTRVLKGHIAIATCVFPDGVTGAQIDTLARRALWEAGLDFDHGTGHGVGSYLSVHEGPARISKLGTVALKRGMILSNEPGYYKTGAYGIRVENLVLVVEAPAVPGAEKPLNTFETLTLVPLDRRLIDTRLLTPEEIAWINSYHHRVAHTLTPHVNEAALAFLDEATLPLSAA